MSRLACILTLALVCHFAMAQSHIDPSQLTFSENIEQPKVPTKASQAIKAHMGGIKESLAKHYDDVSTLRNGEVIVVTIPCSKLFQPNEVQLKESGKMYLRPFLSMMKYPTMYKILVAVHSDDTGEEAYRDALTEKRADVIDQFLQHESYTTGLSLVPYGLGSDDPEKPNDTVENRAANRRVEVYIVPEWQMIETAKSGKLK